MQTPCLGVLPTQKTWLRILLGRKKAPTHINLGRLVSWSTNGIAWLRTWFLAEKKACKPKSSNPILRTLVRAVSKQDMNQFMIVNNFMISVKVWRALRRGSSEGNQISLPKIRHVVWSRWGHSPLHIPWFDWLPMITIKRKSWRMCVRIIVCMEWVSGFCSSSSNSLLFWFQIVKTCQERGE
jgi:hypothetical protein